MAICNVCHNHCDIREGALGLCNARRCENGVVVSDNYGYITSIALDPIEKKPLRCFYPGSKILSVGSYGCNLRCPFCQNNEISYAIEPKTMRQFSRYIAPKELVEIADSCRTEGNIGIAFTYNEPLVGCEYVIDTTREAKKRNLKTVLVSNGCASREICEKIEVDAMNIDLKGFTDEYYSDVLKGNRRMVMDFIEYSARRCHIEVTCLIVPGYNDTEDEIFELSSWLSRLNDGKGKKEIALHISRFFPQFRMRDRDATDIGLIYNLAEIARNNLDNVFTGNC